MDYKKNVPVWDNAGTEPPEDLQKNGFTGGYKPPAAYFNWFWHAVSACLTEIRTKLSGHADNKENPHNVTKAQLGLDKVDNTSDSAKNVAHAAEANKVKQALGIRLNGGSTTSYNGSAAVNVDITPGSIGAAAADLSNVNDTALKEKVETLTGAGIPIAEAASTGGVTYTATIDGITELYDGQIITIIPNMTSTQKKIYLNVNGLGSKEVLLPASRNTSLLVLPGEATYYKAGYCFALQYVAGYDQNGLNPYKVGAWKVLGKQMQYVEDLFGTVAIENGGTGANNVKDARTNLGIPNPVEWMKGQFLRVNSEGEYALESMDIPEPTTDDAGRFLMVDSEGNYVLETVSVATNTDPGAGVEVEYADGTVIDVYE